MMNIKEASKVAFELAKLEKSLEEACKDCQQCATTKLVKNEIINLLTLIIQDQTDRIISLTTEEIPTKLPSQKEASEKFKEKLLELPLNNKKTNSNKLN